MFLFFTECTLVHQACRLLERYQQDSLVISPPPNFGSGYCSAMASSAVHTMPNSSLVNVSYPGVADTTTATLAASVTDIDISANIPVNCMDVNLAATLVTETGIGEEVVLDKEGSPIPSALPLFTRPPLEDR